MVKDAGVSIMMVTFRTRKLPWGPLAAGPSLREAPGPTPRASGLAGLPARVHCAAEPIGIMIWHGAKCAPLMKHWQLSGPPAPSGLQQLGASLPP
jgi:hypothetical protein